MQREKAGLGPAPSPKLESIRIPIPYRMQFTNIDAGMPYAGQNRIVGAPPYPSDLVGRHSALIVVGFLHCPIVNSQAICTATSLYAEMRCGPSVTEG